MDIDELKDTIQKQKDFIHKQYEQKKIIIEEFKEIISNDVDFFQKVKSIDIDIKNGYGDLRINGYGFIIRIDCSFNKETKVSAISETNYIILAPHGEWIHSNSYQEFKEAFDKKTT